MANPNDITAYRKKQRRKTLISRLIIIAVIVIGIALIVLNAEKIFEPFNGIGSRIDNKTSDNVGFPVSLPGSAEYSFEKFGDNFILLTDTYLYNYEQSGKQAFAFQHGYGSPMMSVGNSRVLLYNYSAYEFSIFSRTSKIKSVELDEKIVTAFIGNNDMSAIITSPKRYSNIIYVYDKTGKEKFIKRYTSEHVTAVDFSKDGSEMYVATIKAVGGENYSIIEKYNIKSDDGLLWSYQLPEGAWTLDMKLEAGRLSVLGDKVFISLNPATGSALGSYSYEGNLTLANFGENFSVLGIEDNITNKNLLVTLDTNAGVLATKSMQYDLKQVEIGGNLVYTLEGANIKYYDNSLKDAGNITLSEEYDGFIVIGGYVYLLGYDTVNRADLVNDINVGTKDG